MSSRVLCFGDSLTWGYDPDSGTRFPTEQAWPAIMADTLGDVDVIVEGLPGRTTVVDSPYAPGRSGAEFLGPLLESHFPVDTVVIMLGTNDLQGPLGLSARHAASGLWTLLDIALRSACGPEGSPPAVLAVSPPHLVAPTGFMGVFYAGRESESRLMAEAYRPVAERAGVRFFDAATVVTPAGADGVHLDRSGHELLGRAIAAVLATPR
ncbi:MAG: SGNH/GDSL hydrolase family protein [Candidatus Nanopelagicales bacterium]